jgi:thiamine-monophosphate kinase
MEQAATRWSLRLVGGDLVSSPTLAVVVSVIGALHGGAPLRRDGARVGDAVVLVGRLGLGAAGLALHRAGDADVLGAHPELLALHRRPVAQPEGGRALVAAGAHSCIDVSDGLGRDAGHVAAASHVHLRLEERSLPVPDGVRTAEAHLGDDLLAVRGGEDLALLATLPADRIDELARELDTSGIRWARIGEVEAGAGVTLVREDGSEVAIDEVGWEHGTAGA